MHIKFTKMQGIGNDFVLIDGFSHSIELNAEQIRHLADRHFGVGCDQLLLVEKPINTHADFRYRIFNADGCEVEQCGNGARCFVKFVHEKNLTDKTQICVETANGLIYPKLEDNGLVTVNMGAPRFEPAQIPFIADQLALTYSLNINNIQVEISTVSMGNPHAVQIVENIENAPLQTQGPLIENHTQFPQRVNAGFMEIINPHQIKLRVFERGAGETLACGTGACAATVAGIRLGKLKSPVKVVMRGGELNIIWDGENSSVMMTGPAVSVFEGNIEI
ncbi:MAG: diaminopimelate epimerase [Candidatus Methylopumilus sp.]|jgi:diaminopimelate epimerase|nr:diaminopimelate epimerase [Candidatus Methylopumilus sp.]